MSHFRAWFRNLHLPTKVFLVFAPLFSLAVVSIVYLNYSYQEEQTLRQAQGSAIAQALTIKESLVQMMTENERVDDAFLERITRVGDVQALEVLFYLDSLHLASDLRTPERLTRLKEREQKALQRAPRFMDRAFFTGNAEWFVTCAKGEHEDLPVTAFTRDRPFLFSDCDRLEAVIPFPAERKCLQCHNVQMEHVLGAVHVQAPLTKTSAALKANALRSFIVFAIFTIIALGLGAVVFRWYVSRPLDKLVRATETIGSGDLEHTIESPSSDDEFGKLAMSFNSMQSRLKDAQSELIMKERLSLVGQMASSIVHDFRGPLTAIGVGLELLKNDELAGRKKHELHEQVRTAMERMSVMMQELLDYSRGEIKLNFTRVQIGKFVEGMASVMEPYLATKGITFRVLCEYTGEATVDKDRLLRALLDILHNAEDATSAGETITFSVRAEDEMLRFSVQDTGQGVPEGIKDRIFEPFVTSGKVKGTGLGLAVVKKIVDQHGGRVWFDSVGGVGTTFYVLIPTDRIG